MADLIDRDVFILSLKERRAKAYLSELYDCDTEAEKQRIDDEMYYSTQSFIDVMKCQPTVDAVPVVHAHWVERFTGNEYVVECSNCKNESNEMADYHVEYDYCPHCGAKMHEKEGCSDG